MARIFSLPFGIILHDGLEKLTSSGNTVSSEINSFCLQEGKILPSVIELGQ